MFQTAYGKGLVIYINYYNKQWYVPWGALQYAPVALFPSHYFVTQLKPGFPKSDTTIKNFTTLQVTDLSIRVYEEKEMYTPANT